MQGLIAADKGHGAAVYISALFGVMTAGRFYIARQAEGFGLYALGGALGGVIALYFVSMLARNFSRWFGGKAELKAVRTALGIALLPHTLLAAIFFFVLATGMDAESAQKLMPLFAGLFLYGYIIILLSMAAALGLTVLRTFLCLVLTFVIAFFFISFAVNVAMQLSGATPPTAPAPAE